MTRPPQSLMLPSLGLFLGGALWGAIWIPLRAIGEAGPALAWPGVLVYFGAAVLLTPVVILRWRNIRANAGGLILCGLLTGAAFSFYITSLFFTDVVRAILLFYLTPIWGTILGALVLREQITKWRFFALVSGLAGLVVVLWEGGSLPLPRNPGDWLALAAGMAWALGSLQLYRMPRIEVAEQALAFVWGSLIVSLICIAVMGEALGAIPTLGQLQNAVPLIILTSIYVVPMVFLTIWPARLLTPGRVGLLLMSDVLVAVLTALAFSGEHFGLREGLGTVLIVSAAFLEVMGPIWDNRRLLAQKAALSRQK